CWPSLYGRLDDRQRSGFGCAPCFLSPTERIPALELRQKSETWLDGHVHLYASPVSRLTPASHRRGNALRSPAHTKDAEAGPVRSRLKALAIVFDGKHVGVAKPAKRNADTLRVSVAN